MIISVICGKYAAEVLTMACTNFYRAAPQLPQVATTDGTATNDSGTPKEFHELKDENPMQR